MSIVARPQDQVNGSSDPIEQLCKLLNLQILRVNTIGDYQSSLAYLLELSQAAEPNHVYLGELKEFISQKNFQLIVANQTGRWPARVSRADWDQVLVLLTAAAVKL